MKSTGAAVSVIFLILMNLYAVSTSTSSSNLDDAGEPPANNFVIMTVKPAINNRIQYVVRLQQMKLPLIAQLLARAVYNGRRDFEVPPAGVDIESAFFEGGPRGADPLSCSFISARKVEKSGRLGGQDGETDVEYRERGGRWFQAGEVVSATAVVAVECEATFMWPWIPLTAEFDELWEYRLNHGPGKERGWGVMFQF